MDPRKWFSRQNTNTSSVPSETPTEAPVAETGAAPSPLGSTKAPSNMQASIPMPAQVESPSKRLARQSALLFGGGIFLTLSVLTTRRSMARKYAATYPGFYRPNNAPPSTPPPNAAKEAVEALGLATLNTFAFAMVLIGGGMVATDISSLAELKARFKDAIGEHKEDDEEMEEWMVSILARSEIKEKAKKLAEKVDETRKR